MDFIVIGLIVLIFLVLYGLYWFMLSAALTKGMVLLTKKETINYEKLDVAGNNIYYDGWIFILTAPADTSPIVSRELAISLRQGTNGPAFIVQNIEVVGGKQDEFIITEDLPLQKWVHFAVRYKDSVLETYLNGKLIKTVYYPGLIRTYSKTADLEVGGNVNGYLTKLRRLTEPLNSIRIWESYLEGNGQFSGTLGYLFNYVDSYNAKIKISKNDITQREMSLF
jgi:hypothetical protein